jgi:zinc protease
MSPRRSQQRALASAASLALFALSALLALAGCASAPPPVKAAPAAPSPQELASADLLPSTEGDVTSARVEGMQLVVQRLPGAELAAVQLYLRGGARNWGAQDAGVEALALRAATSGGMVLGGRPVEKEAFGRLLASAGLTLSSETQPDWSVIQGKGPVSQLGTLLPVVAGALVSPLLPQAEVELVRQRLLLQLKRSEEQPDGRLDRLLARTFYKDHPFAHDPSGTVESVSSLTQEQVVRHHQRLRETSRLLLVVVGDVDPRETIERARALFAGLPRGSYQESRLAAPQFAAAALQAEESALPTNYLAARFPGPGLESDDYPAGRIALRMLAQRLFEEVRTKRNLSYAPGAWYTANGAGGVAQLYVSAVDPDTTFGVMLGEVRRLREQPITEAELKAARAQLRTRFAMNGETTDGLAAQLAQGALLAADFRWARRHQAALEQVTAAQVQAFMQRYAALLQVCLLGDPRKLDAARATSL